MLPYIFLAAPAGYLADRFSKRTVIVGCKVAEMVLMMLGIASILWGNLYLMYVVLSLMGAQAALFSPAKWLHSRNRPRRSAFGGQRLDGPDDHRGHHRRHGGRRRALDLTGRRGTRALGDLGCRVAGRGPGRAGRQPVALPRCGRPIPAGVSPLTPWVRRRDLATLGANRALLMAALASAFYWFLAAAAK